MNRDKAEEFTKQVTVDIRGFKAVAKSDAKKLLACERYRLLMLDPIKRVGPTNDSIYPWNVVDYLSLPQSVVDAKIREIELNEVKSKGLN
jgi:hypothetical protein